MNERTQTGVSLGQSLDEALKRWVDNAGDLVGCDLEVTVTYDANETVQAAVCPHCGTVVQR